MTGPMLVDLTDSVSERGRAAAATTAPKYQNSGFNINHTPSQYKHVGTRSPQRQQHSSEHYSRAQSKRYRHAIRARSRTISPPPSSSISTTFRTSKSSAFVCRPVNRFAKHSGTIRRDSRSSYRGNKRTLSGSRYDTKENPQWSPVYRAAGSRIEKPNSSKPHRLATTNLRLQESVSDVSTQRKTWHIGGNTVGISDEEGMITNALEMNTGTRQRIGAQQNHDHSTNCLRSTSIGCNHSDKVTSTDTDSPFSMIPNTLCQDDDIEIIQWTERRQSRSSIDCGEIVSVTQNGVKCASGKDVELKSGGFMRIQKIVQDSQSKKWLIGQFFLRHNDLEGAKWPRRSNEVVLMATVRGGRMIDVVKKPVQDVLKHRHLILTNEVFPMVSRTTHQDSIPDIQRNKEIGPLFCRWRQVFVVDDAGKTIEESIERLSAAAADAEPNTHIDDFQLRLRWRKGFLKPGGEHVASKTHIEEDGQKLVKVQTYSFGDAFCGAGGASCGADLAGLHVKFGVDISEQAITTYKLNFLHKGTKCYQREISDFIAGSGHIEHLIDVLHISPPCQPFSPAHTIMSLHRDERNQAAIFAVGALLMISRPRVVTLEQTFGLFNRHHEWFEALIKMFLDLGYSIRWTGARLEEYGLPQKRKRLLLIAAGPGETLPPFPSTTHSAVDKSKNPLCTINDAIGNIPARSSISHHDIRAATYEKGQFRIPYSAQTLAKTITTSGGIGNHHPSGKRSFTLRELASLQKFPLTYKFADLGVTELRRQIGNAVPPTVFKKIYREIIVSLKKTDGLL